MTPALRPPFAVCLLTLLTSPVHAKTKPRKAAAFAWPLACTDFYSQANGALGNLPAFAKTYACKAGQPMFKNDTEQVALWR